MRQRDHDASTSEPQNSENNMNRRFPASPIYSIARALVQAHIRVKIGPIIMIADRALAVIAVVIIVALLIWSGVPSLL